MVEENTIDPLVEMEVLFDCAQVVVNRRELPVVQVSAPMRRVVTAWEAANDMERRRLVVRSVYNEAHGPGVEVGWIRQAWVDVASPMEVTAPMHPEHGPSPWETRDRTREDIQEEEEISREIRSCWQASFDQRYAR